MVAIISDKHLETISECSHDSFGHRRGNSDDFPTNTIPEGLKIFRSVCVHLWFEIAPQEEITGSETRQTCWPPDIAVQGDQLPRKHFPPNFNGSPRRMSCCSILLKPGICHIHFFHFFQALKNAIRQKIAANPLAMTERDMRAFRNRLEECIANDGHHLGDIIFKKWWQNYFICPFLCYNEIFCIFYYFYRINIWNVVLLFGSPCISHKACEVCFGEYYSKHHILQTGLTQGAVTSCTLFNLYINDLISELNWIPGIKCSLYADDLVFWTKVDKRKAEEKTEH